VRQTCTRLTSSIFERESGKTFSFARSTEIVTSAAFADLVPAWENKQMHLRRPVNFLIALLVAMGLVSAPFAAFAAGKSALSAITSSVEKQGMGEMPGMADDMPCCPDQKKGDDCACPLLALCSLSISLPAPSGHGWLVRPWSRNAFALPDDPAIDGLGEHPPDHPPRIPV
jgi:hypothetical protein